MSSAGESAWAAAGWTHYDVLGVAEDADSDAIRRAFRMRAQELHPDLHPADPDAAAAMRAVNEAWAVLGEESRRAVYDDALRRRAVPAGSVDQVEERVEDRQMEQLLFPRPLRIPVTVIILIVLAVIFVVTAYAGPH
jgi:curved DNA-binding protein CbpA